MHTTNCYSVESGCPYKSSCESHYSRHSQSYHSWNYDCHNQYEEPHSSHSQHYKPYRKSWLDPPVEIHEENTTNIDLPPITWHGYDCIPKILSVTNTGRTILINGQWSNGRPYIKGGPLNGSYIFSQIHFHCPSEHEIDGRRYPLEMHVVHYKTSYLTQERAMHEKDGTVVLVYLFKVIDTNMTVLSHVTRLAPCLEKVNSRRETTKISLDNIVKPFMSNYYVYWGSVNTEKNSYLLQWIINCDHLHVTKQEVDDMLNLMNCCGTPNPNRLTRMKPENDTVFRVGEEEYCVGVCKSKSLNKVCSSCRTSSGECQLTHACKTRSKISLYKKGSRASCSSSCAQEKCKIETEPEQCDPCSPMEVKKSEKSIKSPCSSKEKVGKEKTKKTKKIKSKDKDQKENKTKDVKKSESVTSHEIKSKETKKTIEKKSSKSKQSKNKEEEGKADKKEKKKAESKSSDRSTKSSKSEKSEKSEKDGKSTKSTKSHKEEEKQKENKASSEKKSEQKQSSEDNIKTLYEKKQEEKTKVKIIENDKDIQVNFLLTPTEVKSGPSNMLIMSQDLLTDAKQNIDNENTAETTEGEITEAENSETENTDGENTETENVEPEIASPKNVGAVVGKKEKVIAEQLNEFLETPDNDFINTSSSIEQLSNKSKDQAKELCLHMQHLFQSTNKEEKQSLFTCQEYHVAIEYDHCILQEYEGKFEPNTLEPGGSETLNLIPKRKDTKDLQILLQDCTVSREPSDQVSITAKFVLKDWAVDDSSSNITHESPREGLSKVLSAETRCVLEPNNVDQKNDSSMISFLNQKSSQVAQTEDTENKLKRDSENKGSDTEKEVKDQNCYSKKESEENDIRIQKNLEDDENEFKKKITEQQECEIKLLKSPESCEEETAYSASNYSIELSTQEKGLKDSFNKQKKIVYFMYDRIEKHPSTGKKIFVGSFRTKEEVDESSKQKPNLQSNEANSVFQKSQEDNERKKIINLETEESNSEELVKVENWEAEAKEKDQGLKSSSLEIKKSTCDFIKNIVTLHKFKPKRVKSDGKNLLIGKVVSQINYESENFMHLAEIIGLNKKKNPKISICELQESLDNNGSNTSSTANYEMGSKTRRKIAKTSNCTQDENKEAENSERKNESDNDSSSEKPQKTSEKRDSQAAIIIIPIEVESLSKIELILIEHSENVKESDQEDEYIPCLNCYNRSIFKLKIFFSFQKPEN